MPADAAPELDGLDLPPLTARSIVLSTLLGLHPPQAPAREVVRIAALFGVGETTVRAALSRMVTAGDLVNVDATYRLTERLRARQVRQDAGLRPARRAWRGRFELVVVTAAGRTAGDRAALRAELTGLRLAELREGVWLRPANLRRTWPAHLGGVARRMHAVPDDPPGELVATLWDLPAWSARGAALLAAERRAPSIAARFTLAAAVLRHLLTDPVLPVDLQPPGWPADALGELYPRLRADLVAATAAPAGTPGAGAGAGAGAGRAETVGRSGGTGRSAAPPAG